MNIVNINLVYLLNRTTLIFIVLLILARILGKQQISHLTFFNYISGITIGSIAANMISLSNELFIDEFLSLTWWCILTGLVSFISLKSGTLRLIIDGEPSIINKKRKNHKTFNEKEPY